MCADVEKMSSSRDCSQSDFSDTELAKQSIDFNVQTFSFKFYCTSNNPKEYEAISLHLNPTILKPKLNLSGLQAQVSAEPKPLFFIMMWVLLEQRFQFLNLVCGASMITLIAWILLLSIILI